MTPSQPSLYHDPSLRLRVPRTVLEGGGARPFRKRLFTRMVKRLLPKLRVKVERLSDSGLSASVLYAPDQIPPNTDPPLAETSLTGGHADGNVVYRDSPFEIRATGMLVENFDHFPSKGRGKNELLMYSMQTDPKTSGANGEGLPFIHFDHRSDSYHNIENANVFIPIPASKAYVTGSAGREASEGTSEPNSVNVRFKVIELDEPSETVKQAIQGIDSLGGVIGELSVAAPMLGALSPALAVAGAVSKRALDSYAQPDKVMSVDMDFLLADRARVADGTAPPGEYLRYGYYFFFSEPVESKLYASVLTPRNLQLMMRRVDDDPHPPTRLSRRPVGCKQFIPLTQTSYIVVRVCEPVYGAPQLRRPVQIAHARQLEEIFDRSRSSDGAEDLKRAVKLLGEELGFIRADAA